MSKCKLCGKEDNGLICNACLSDGATKVGKGIKKVSKPIYLAALGTIVLVGKYKSKD